MNKLLLTLLSLTISLNMSNTANAQVEGVNEEVAEKLEEAIDAAETALENVEAVAGETMAAVAEEVEKQVKSEINADPLENVLLLELKDGKVVVQLDPASAPNHVERIKELTREGFYDGVVFHRVIDGFMAQTGDPTGTGRGGSGKNLDAEFNDTKHVKGVVSMARASNPNSADSQFFIMLDDAPHLDGSYTAFGQVIEGMEYVEKITKGFGPNGMVSEPDAIKSLKVAGDLLDEEIPASVLALRETSTEESDTNVDVDININVEAPAE